MKRFLFAISMVLVFGIPSASLAGSAKETGVVAHWSGTYTQHPNIDDGENFDLDGYPVEGVDCTGTVVNAVCIGDLDLVACELGERLAVSLGVFYFLEGICDDSGAGPSPACDGRFTFRGEECLNPLPYPAGDVHLNGSLLSVISRGVTRICFDTPAADPLDCSKILEIGIGNTLTQTRLITGPGISTASATTETTDFSAISFEIDTDVDAKLRFKETVAQITLQRNIGSTGCGSFDVGGCGVAGTSVRSGTTR